MFDSRLRIYQYNEDDFPLLILISTEFSISMDKQKTWKQREAVNSASPCSPVNL